MKQLTVLLPALIVGAVFFSPVAAHADDTPDISYVDGGLTANCDDETYTDTTFITTKTAEGTVTTYDMVRGMLLDYEFAEQCPGLEFVYPSDEEVENTLNTTSVVQDGVPLPAALSPSHTHPKSPGAVTPAPVVAAHVAPPVQPVATAVLPVPDPPKVGLYGDWKVLGG